ncbi:MAG TPA: histidine kinase N-terminal 7TM domain-containing protein [Candidatus Thermoplasmatota archaeon]|nr:histidine kinase N-terminal 7TM domain-containing protein [Candidatus Thermoplasmatota archaeon]
MPWEALLRADTLPVVLATAGMVALAALLLALDFRARLNQAFALFLCLRAVAIFTGLLRELAYDDGDLLTTMYWARVYPYFVIPVPFVVVYFLAHYPRPRGWLGRSRSGGWLLLGLAGALEIVYLANHQLWATYGTALNSNPSASVPIVAEGPLFWLQGLMFLSFAAVALVLSLDTVREPRGPRRQAMLFVITGFALNAVFESFGSVLVILGYFPVEPNLANWLQLPALAMLALAMALLVRRAMRSTDPGLRGGVLRMMIVLPLPMITTFAAPLHPGYLFMLGVWRLALPVLVTVALLRYQLFDLELKVRWTVKQSTIAAAFVVLFFVASELAENYIADSTGPIIGIAAAGVLTIALRPLQKMAERVAVAAVPGAKPVEQLSTVERDQLYREQLRFCWANGDVDARERRMLDHLRDRLGLPEAAAARLEAEVVRELAQGPRAAGAAAPA